MRTADLELFDRVIFGRRPDLAEGRNGDDAYVVAVGRYTTTTGPCGRAVMPYRSRYATQVVVVAVERKRWIDGEYQLVWEPHITTTRSLMDPAEYRVKVDVIRKQERLRRRHEDERRRLQLGIRKLCAQVLAELFGMKVSPDAISMDSSHLGRDDKLNGKAIIPTFTTPGHLLENLVFKRAPEIRDLIDELKEFELSPGPDECKL